MNIFFQTFVLSYTVCFYRTDGERGVVRAPCSRSAQETNRGHVCSCFVFIVHNSAHHDVLSLFNRTVAVALAVAVWDCLIFMKNKEKKTTNKHFYSV